MTEKRKAASKHFLKFALFVYVIVIFQTTVFLSVVYQTSRIIPEKTCAFQTVPVSWVSNFGQQDAWTLRCVMQLPVRDHHTITVSGMSLQREHLSNVYFLHMRSYCCKTYIAHRTVTSLKNGTRAPLRSTPYHENVTCKRSEYLTHIHLQLLYNEPYFETTNTEWNFNVKKEIQGKGTFRSFCGDLRQRQD
jgi:hypothetical protein